MLDHVRHVEAVAILRAIVKDPGNPIPLSVAAQWIVENHPPPEAYTAAMTSHVAQEASDGE